MPQTVATTDISPWLELFGRSHLLLVHFPIALLILAALLEFGGAIRGVFRRRRGRRDTPVTAAGWCLGVGTVLALASTWSGWSLADAMWGEDGGDVTVGIHRWVSVAGLGAAAVACILGMSAATNGSRQTLGLYRAILLVAAGLIGVSGYFGGELVHGANHLLEPFQDEPREQEVQQDVQPPAETPSATPVLEEAPEIETIIDDPAQEQPALREAVIEAIRERGATVRLIALDSEDVDVVFARLGPQVTDEDLTLLTGLEPVLAWLDLSGTSVTDDGARTLSAYPGLRRLILHETAITDAVLPTLAELPALEVLNLHTTAVTDEGIQSLRSSGSLRRLYLWQTGVTPTGAANLRAGAPNLETILGR